MKIAIIISQRDIAGKNIKECLLEKDIFTHSDRYFQDFPIYCGKINTHLVSLFTISDETIYSENLDKKIDAEIFIFATRHQSESGKPSFSVHTPGNFSKAEYGGTDRKLCISFPTLMKTALIELKKNNTLSHEITLEATHHGPFLEKPAMFIEIGSSSVDWENKEAGVILSDSLINAIALFDSRKYSNAIGFGGSHYCTGFNDIMLNSDVAFGHICPKYMFGCLDEEIIFQMINRSNEKPDLVILDWKGLGSEKQKLIDILNKLNINYIKTKEIS
ncbi:MAG: D-aminoacyl-tRNA deacylase [archaeon]